MSNTDWRLPGFLAGDQSRQITQQILQKLNQQNQYTGSLQNTGLSVLERSEHYQDDGRGNVFPVSPDQVQHAEYPSQQMQDYYNAYATPGSYSEYAPSPDFSYEKSAKNPMEFDTESTFASEMPESILVCGPPKCGKTSLFRNVLFAMSNRADIAYIFTETKETLDYLEYGSPRQTFFTELRTDILAIIMEIHEREYIAGNRLIGIVILDDILMGANKRKATEAVEVAVKRAHRCGIIFVACVHGIANIWGDAKDCFGIKMQCGLMEVAGKQIADFYSQFCTNLYPTLGEFKQVYESTIKSPGHAFIVQKDKEGQSQVTVWRPEDAKFLPPFCIGHRDWFITCHQFADPVRTFSIRPDGVTPKWNYIGKNGMDNYKSAPSLALLKMQEKGERLPQSYTDKSIMIQSAPAKGKGAKGGAAKEVTQWALNPIFSQSNSKPYGTS